MNLINNPFLNLIPEINSDFVFITGDFSFIPRLRIGNKKSVLDMLVDAIKMKSDKATVVFPTASMNLCNTSIPFSLKETPSNKMGALSEHYRTKPNALRSLHPFWSVGAIGARASDISSKVSKHAFANNSPWDRLCNNHAIQLTIAKDTGFALTTIHHCETICAVPYRYTKEFNHPIKDKNGDIQYSNYYMSVFYKDMGITKKLERNSQFLSLLSDTDYKKYVVPIFNFNLKISTLDLYKFREVTCNELSQNVYSYLETPPLLELRPYIK